MNTETMLAKLLHEERLREAAQMRSFPGAPSLFSTIAGTFSKLFKPARPKETAERRTLAVQR